MTENATATEETTDAGIADCEAKQAPPTTVEITADTMLGELVSLVIDELKAAPDVWQKLSQYRQDDVIHRVTARCTALVKDAVNLIAADGRDVITADLEQITAKDGIKAVCTLPKHDENRHALLDAVGKPVLIVVASSAQYMGGKLPVSDPQQPQLPVGEATDKDDTPVADNTEAAAA